MLQFVHLVLESPCSIESKIFSMVSFATKDATKLHCGKKEKKEKKEEKKEKKKKKRESGRGRGRESEIGRGRGREREREINTLIIEAISDEE